MLVEKAARSEDVTHCSTLMAFWSKKIHGGLRQSSVFKALVRGQGLKMQEKPCALVLSHKPKL